MTLHTNFHIAASDNTLHLKTGRPSGRKGSPFHHGMQFPLIRRIRNMVPALWLILLAGPYATAQDVEVHACLDTNEILIGDQISLHLRATAPKDVTISWPLFHDTLVRSIEIIGRSNPDTVETKKDINTVLSQEIQITSFDSGHYSLPSIPFYYTRNGDTSIYTAHSEPLSLYVNTVEIDTAQAIRPIKPPLHAPVTFREMLPWILAALGIIFLGWLIYYIIQKKKKQKPLFVARPKPKLPPHVLALEGLEKLRYKKLWQNGKYKEYHTEMTGLIRDYIEERFDVQAVEMTTDEIIRRLKTRDVHPEALDKITQVFQLADLVKFAREKPLPLENDISLNHCIDFVKETMRREADPPEEPEHKEVNEKQLKEAPHA